MSFPSAILRPALGQVAQIGTLYDASTDRFLQDCLFAANYQPHRSVVQATQYSTPRESKTIGSVADAFGGKFKLLGIPDSLGASVMGGLLELDGGGSDSAAFLARKEVGSTEAQVALLHRSFVLSEWIKLKSPDLGRSIDRGLLRHLVATHVVVAIDWGVETVVSINLASNTASNKDRSAASEIVTKAAEFLKSSPEANGSLQNPLPSVIAGQVFDISVYSNTLSTVVRTDNLNEAAKAISQSAGLVHPSRDALPGVSQQGRKNRGMPVRYRLLPIDDFRAAFVGPKLVRIEPQCFEYFSASLENLLAAYRSFAEYKGFLETNQRYAQASHVSTVNALVKNLETSISSLKAQYGSALREVRAGRESMTTLDALCESAAVAAARLCSEADVVGQERYKVEFIARAVGSGATYLSYDEKATPAALTSFLAKNSPNDNEAYVLSFSLDGMLYSESWAGNEALVMEMLGTGAPVLLLDYDASGKRPDGPRLAQYAEKIEVTRDVLGEREFLVDKCLARSADRSSYSKNARPPIARRVVRIPCPKPGCDEDPPAVHSWLCAKCHHVLEYGYSDAFIYCECGHSPFATFEFRCSNAARHGSAYVAYADRSRLEQLLQALPSSDYINILLLGETGVGKSTFINAFINYISFDNLDDALQNDQLHWVIPCSFSTQVMDRTRPGGKITEHRIVVGKRDDESDGSRGNSATQQTSVYPINIGAKTIRLIDTPGVGDTRGPAADRKNMADILATINSYDELHGIIILLKSNNARLTVTFRFCIQELLTHLHRDALHNIVFGFTNTRISNYTPGDTFGPLKTLLEQHPDIVLPLNGDTTYCFDSESFRYLAARRQGIEMENEDSFRRSWAHSSDEANRLMSYFRSRQPHLVTNTISLNGTRQLILGLTKPMAEITQLIQQNITQGQAQEKILNDGRLAGNDLRKRLQFQKQLLRHRSLAKPRTVCADRSCIEVRDNGSGQKVTVYKAHCHPECYLEGVRVEAIGQPGLINCWAFGGTMCRQCGHHWRNHLHVMYELEPYTTTMTDPAIQKQLNSNANDARVREQALTSIKKLIAEYQQEHDQVQRAAALFGAYLKAKSIATHNDATAEYLEGMIRLETEVSAVSGDKTRLDALRQDLRYHEELVLALTQGDKLPDDWEGVDTTLNESSIDKLVQGLYGLKHFGALLRDVHQTVKQSHQATYRERPYHVRQQKRRGASPVRKPNGGGRGASYMPNMGNISARVASAFGYKTKPYRDGGGSRTASSRGNTWGSNVASAQIRV
ncbi:hypothetical protein B0T16DRAFT_315380 [Cercophora newfieldiana]|uniref:G domain-containing protein n=1 Tax=Cercophora newfieldiana TaxID=92897 RepID=A0AA39YSE8_9PEZI|nr:hypothetical protein B0T16DRAFT_315380 [Cercophora newfieldiana]